MKEKDIEKEIEKIIKNLNEDEKIDLLTTITLSKLFTIAQEKSDEDIERIQKQVDTEFYYLKEEIRISIVKCIINTALQELELDILLDKDFDINTLNIKVEECKSEFNLYDFVIQFTYKDKVYNNIFIKEKNENINLEIYKYDFKE